MIEFNAMFWCEFAASLAVAIAAWVAGYFFLLRGQVAPDVRDAELPKLDENRPGSPEYARDFLREVVRLAEDRIKSQDEFARFIQWKAALLGGLSVFTVAFLFTGEFGAPGGTLMTGVAAVFLVVASGFCAKTLDLGWYGQLGYHAPVILSDMEQVREGSVENLWKTVLADHYNSIKVNSSTNGRKAADIERAKKLWVWGTSAALGAMAANTAAAKLACEYLIRLGG